MSEAYKQKEYELRSAIDNISSILYVFENYVEETENFIDRLLEDTYEINTLRNKLQQKENIIKEVREYIEKLLREEIEITDENNVDYGMKCQRAYFSDSELGKVLDILDKVDKGE